MTSTEILAPGIVKFSSCFSLSQSQIDDLARLREEAFNQAYDFIFDEDGNLLYGVNESHHIFPADCIFSVHTTIGNGVEKQLLQTVDSAIYDCLLNYLTIYPDALQSIWWRTVGHVAAYPEGTSLSVHSDNDVNYRPGTRPQDQAAVQHALSCSALLNDNFEGGAFAFEYYDLELQLSAGDILLFPSNFLGAHEVKEITKGTRFSYVTWFGQGSPDPTKNINPQYPSDPTDRPGQIWMDQLFADFHSKVLSNDGLSNRIFNRAKDH